MQENLNDIGLFVAVARAGSMTKAGEEQGLSKSAVSNGIARLESRLGVRLFHRTTRSMRLTDEGQRFFERAQEVVDAAAEAEAEVAQMHATAIGTLRLSVPVSWGQRFLDAVLAQYLGQQPSVEVVVDATDRDVDLIEEGYDLAVRAGELKDSSLMARKLATSRRLVVASPQYLRQRGAPKNPEELRQHECLLYRHQRSGDVWELDGKRGRQRISVHGRLRCNNGDMIAAACMRGTGVGFLPDFIVLPLVKKGELEVVLEQYCRTYLPIHALYPSRRHLSAKVRLFLDALSVPLKEELTESLGPSV